MWHQILKRVSQFVEDDLQLSLINYQWMTVCATSLTTLLGIHRSSPGIRSLIEGVIWLWTVFFLSGLVHVGGEYMAIRQLLLNGGIFKFFMLQPVAIILERVLLPRTMGATSTRRGSHPPSIPIRVVGYFWVVLWFTWGFVPVIDVYLPTGLMTMKLLQDLVNVRFEVHCISLIKVLETDRRDALDCVARVSSRIATDSCLVRSVVYTKELMDTLRPQLVGFQSPLCH